MRLLLAEDDLPLADALTALLAGIGYAVDCVHDGASADALVAVEAFDLVILDLNLPQMDGLSVLRAMRRMWKRRGSADLDRAGRARRTHPGAGSGGRRLYGETVRRG